MQTNKQTIKLNHIYEHVQKDCVQFHPFVYAHRNTNTLMHPLMSVKMILSNSDDCSFMAYFSV